MGRPLQEGILLLGSGQQRWNKEGIHNLYQDSSTAMTALKSHSIQVNWKKAKAAPIFKKDRMDNPGNH